MSDTRTATDSGRVGVDPGRAFTGEEEPIAIAPIPIGTPLRIPRGGRSPLESTLAEANEQRRAGAVAHAEQLLPGLPVRQIAQATSDRRPVVLGAGDLLHRLGGVDLVDRVVAGIGGFVNEAGLQLWAPAAASASEASRPAPEAGPSIGTGALVTALQAGWCASVPGVEALDAEARRIGDLLTAALGWRVDATLWIAVDGVPEPTMTAQRGDVLIVPLTGCRRWEVSGPTQGPTAAARATEPAWAGELATGAALVVPSRWTWGSAGGDGLQAWLVLQVHRLRVHDLLERIQFEAGSWPLMRADVPIDPDGEVHSYAGSIFDDREILTEVLEDVIGAELVERGLASHRARLRTRRPGTLSETARSLAAGDWSGLPIHLDAPVGALLAAEADDAVVLAFSDRLIRATPPAAAVIAHLLAGTASTLTEVATAVGGPVEDLVASLVRLGLASVGPLPASR